MSDPQPRWLVDITERRERAKARGCCERCQCMSELDCDSLFGHIVEAREALCAMIALYDAGESHNDLVVDAARKALNGGK